MKEMCSSSGSYIEIWLYSEYTSMKLNSSCPTVMLTNWSIRGKEKLFLGHALLRFVKSRHVVHFSFGLITSTGLASQSG